MNTASKTAIGGLMMALSVVILIPTALEFFVYALPAMAGLIIMFCVIELNKRWAAGVFAGAAVISLLLVPNKEAAVLYAAFFGYYPILKAIFESKLPRALEYSVKYICFNVAMVAAYFVLIKVFGMPFDQLMGIDDSSPAFFAKFAVPIMLAAGNVIFFFYDLCLTRMASVYVNVWQSKLRKRFRFKR